MKYILLNTDFIIIQCMYTFFEIPRTKSSGVRTLVGPPMAIRSKRKHQTERDQHSKKPNGGIDDLNRQNDGRGQRHTGKRNRSDPPLTDQTSDSSMQTGLPDLAWLNPTFNREAGASGRVCWLIRSAELSTKIKFTRMASSNFD